MKTCELKIEGTCSKARAGVFQTERGEVKTPVFMPVGTKGAVKTVKPDSLKDLGAQVILGNTYHLYLKPGHEYIEEHFQSLHHLMNWHGPILTDSGGFQVYSLSTLNKVTEDGVEFRSHIDGSKHFFSPETSIAIQRALGSDIVMAFDECPKLPIAKTELEKSLQRTHRWAKRCAEVELKSHQYLFGIVQGGVDLEARQFSLKSLIDIGFSSYAIGGLSVGEKNEQMRQLLEHFVQQMPEERPRYLMGVGTPKDLLHGIKSGIDMFDCVLPSRNARNGQVFNRQGTLNVKNAKFRHNFAPIDENCQCPTCKNYNLAQLHHFYRTDEPLVATLLTEHNLYFFLDLMREAREHILNETFDEFYESFYKMQQ